MNWKPLPIGVDDFRELIVNGYNYIDKTLLIEELYERKGKVTLFTRPRRFGKSLNLSMLQYFYEDTGDKKRNTENKRLFDGLKIMDAGKAIVGRMGKYPVISLSLKSAKQPTLILAMSMLKRQITQEFARHQEIAAKIGNKRERFDRILQEKGADDDYVDALAFLSSLLKECYHQNVIILIDEYDVPLENAYLCGFYEEMMGFIRSLFETALKSNPSLEFAVITGCLRISKESIFTGLNNLNVISIISSQYDEYFGFSQQEVNKLLRDYGCEDDKELVKEWYDGYLFGSSQVYNPWSIINYLAESTAGRSFPKPYWSNTSSNSIVKELVEHAGMEVRLEIEHLMAGLTIEKQIHEDITYSDVWESEDNLWNFLFFTGYLKMVSSRMEGEVRYMTMAIPNAEVRYIYRNTVLAWFDHKLKTTDLTPLYRAFDEGDTQGMETLLTELLSETISFYDYAENYYHGFVAGILKGNGMYQVKSNRESGTGRADLILRTPSARGRAFVIEIKVADSLNAMEKGCDDALRQIEDRGYQRELIESGYKNIWLYGICFYKKDAAIKLQRYTENDKSRG